MKAPGLPALLVPPYAALKALGADDLARDAAREAREGGARQWTYRGLNVHAYGYDPDRATRVKALLADQAPMIWALGLLGSVLPTLLLLLLVRWLANRWRPGLGTVTALSLGTATIVMTFAVNLFGHMLAAFMTFAVFALLWRERARARPGFRSSSAPGCCPASSSSWSTRSRWRAPSSASTPSCTRGRSAAASRRSPAGWASTPRG